MSRTFLKVAATILSIAVVLNAILGQFGILKFENSNQRVVFSFVLVLLFLITRMCLKKSHDFGEISVLPGKSIRFSLKDLLFLITASSFLLGLAQIWPLLASASAGTFVCRAVSRYLSLRNTIEESFEWASMVTIMFIVVQVDSPTPGPGFGEVCLSVMLAAAIGGSLAVPLQKSLWGNGVGAKNSTEPK